MVDALSHIKSFDRRFNMAKLVSEMVASLLLVTLSPEQKKAMRKELTLQMKSLEQEHANKVREAKESEAMWWDYANTLNTLGTSKATE
jgi:hypothetical protein